MNYSTRNSKIDILFLHPAIGLAHTFHGNQFYQGTDRDYTVIKHKINRNMFISKDIIEVIFNS